MKIVSLFMILFLFSGCGKLKKWTGIGEEEKGATSRPAGDPSKTNRPNVDTERNRGLSFCKRSVFIQRNIMKQLADDLNLEVENCTVIKNEHLGAINEMLIDSSLSIELKDGDMDGLVNLQILELRTPMLTADPSVLRDLRELKTFTLTQYSSSNFTEIWTDVSQINLPLGLFDGLTELHTIKITGGNNEDEEPQGIGSFPAGLFLDLAGLRKFQLNNNAVRTFPVGFFDNNTSLEILDLSLNKLDALPLGLFKKLRAIKLLDLGANMMWLNEQERLREETAAMGLDHAVVYGIDHALVCGRTQQVKDFLIYNLEKLCEYITSADLTGVTGTLDLGSPELTSLKAGDFDGLSSLENLYLDNSQISTIEAGTFDELSSLVDLRLYNNQISTLPEGIFDGLSSLVDLHLYNNQISTIEAGVFDGLSSLEELILDNSQISTIEAGTFDELSSLEKLYLRNNQISTIEAGTFDELSSLERLFLYNNKLPEAEVTRITNEVDALDLSWFSIDDQDPD